MAEIKGTPMLLKVDLQCPRCYKKIKKLLCRFHEIRDQVFDAKQNTVRIVVYCCTPERIRQKLICKGGKTIQSIEIIQPPKPKPPPPQPQEKPEKLPPVVVPAAPIPKPQPQPASPKEQPPPPKPADPPAPPPKQPPPPQPAPLQMPPQAPVMPIPAYPTPVPVGYCCPPPYYERPPCYGTPPPPPPPPYDGRPWPCHCGCGGRTYFPSRCDYYYFSEENPSSACSIM